MLLNLGCKKLKGLGELMCTLNALEGKVCLDTKRLGSARFPTCVAPPGRPDSTTGPDPRTRSAKSIYF